MSYAYIGEKITFGYKVAVEPPPADESEADICKQSPEGEVAKTEQLKKEGSGDLTVDTSSFTVDDSPLFIKFRFSKEDTPKVFEFLQGISLAEAAPAKIEPAESMAKIGDKIKFEVKAWAALAYDEPGEATEFDEDEPSRIPKALKDAVKWRLGEEDLPGTGTSIEVEVKEEHRDTTLVVEAYVGDEPPGRAQATIDCFILKLRLLDECYAPCGGVAYKLTLGSGGVLSGSVDGDGWLEQPIPSDTTDLTVEYTPKGEEEPLVLPVKLATDPESDEALMAHLENLGYVAKGDTPATSITRFQAAYEDLELTGTLDQPTKDALEGMITDGDFQDCLYFPVVEG